MKLCMEVGLGLGHIVLDGDPSLLQKGGTVAPPLFGPYVLWPNGRLSQQLLSSCVVLLLQPTRLNVVRNDSDTWDYTNPNLGNLLFFLIY